MITPDGKECPYYYANVHRRTLALEKCNLITGGPFEQDWHSGLCATCQVPAIKRANNCPEMVLSLRIIKRGLRFWERDRVVVEAHCPHADGPIKNPMIGCGHCHTPITFVVSQSEEEG